MLGSSCFTRLGLLQRLEANLSGRGDLCSSGHRQLLHKIKDSTTYRGKTLKTPTLKSGYQIVCLSRNGVTTTYLVHQLVSKAFLPPPDGPIGTKKGEYHVHHKNGDKSDNRVQNLEYVKVEDHVAMHHSDRQRGRQRMRQAA